MHILNNSTWIWNLTAVYLRTAMTSEPDREKWKKSFSNNTSSAIHE